MHIQTTLDRRAALGGADYVSPRSPSGRYRLQLGALMQANNQLLEAHRQ